MGQERNGTSAPKIQLFLRKGRHSRYEHQQLWCHVFEDGATLSAWTGIIALWGSCSIFRSDSARCNHPPGESISSKAFTSSEWRDVGKDNLPTCSEAAHWQEKPGEQHLNSGTVNEADYLTGTNADQTRRWWCCWCKTSSRSQVRVHISRNP